MAKRVGIFWDYENCHPSTSLNGCKVARSIRNLAEPYGNVDAFNAYVDVSLERHKSIGLLEKLRASGVSMVDCPHLTKKDVVDRALILDMFTFAFRSSSPVTVVIITGDGDFTCAVSTLRMVGHLVVLISPKKNTPGILKQNVDVNFGWEDAIQCGNGLKSPTTGAPDPLRHPQSPPMEVLAAKHASSRPESVPSMPKAPELCTISPEIPGTFEVLVSVMLREKYFGGNAARFTGLTDLLRKADPNYYHKHGSSSAKKYILAARDLHLVVISGSEKKDSFSVELSRSVIDGTLNATADGPSPGTAKESRTRCMRPSAPQTISNFAILVEVLNELRYKNRIRVKFDSLARLLLERDPCVYSQAGCENLEKYVEAAREESLVDLGSDWVELVVKPVFITASSLKVGSD